MVLWEIALNPAEFAGPLNSQNPRVMALRDLLETCSGGRMTNAHTLLGVHYQEIKNRGAGNSKE